jgi:hypothetical protein
MVKAEAVVVEGAKAQSGGHGQAHRNIRAVPGALFSGLPRLPRH